MAVAVLVAVAVERGESPPPDGPPLDALVVSGVLEALPSGGTTVAEGIVVPVGLGEAAASLPPATPVLVAVTVGEGDDCVEPSMGVVVGVDVTVGVGVNVVAAADTAVGVAVGEDVTVAVAVAEGVAEGVADGCPPGVTTLTGAQSHAPPVVWSSSDPETRRPISLSSQTMGETSLERGSVPASA